MNGVVFITWEKHQRTRTICAKLGIKLHEKLSNYRGIKRYVSLCFSTITTIRQEKPRVVIAQNPSVILCLLALFLRPFYRYRLFIDAHNEAITPYIHNNAIFRFIAKYLASKADIVIVTNSVLAKTVIQYGGRPFILPDLLPSAINACTLIPESKSYFHVTLVSTYAPDEPYQNVFEAISQIDGDIKVFVTGKIPKHLQKDHLDSRIHLTDYLSDLDYDELLQKSDLIIDLTTMENCLVCGAYEALAIEKPMILSKGLVNEELFPCAVLTDNSASDLVNAVKFAITNIDMIKERTIKQRSQFLNHEKVRLTNFIRNILNV